MTDPMFSPGQCVIYGANGVCTVDGVREMQLPYDDEAQSYYVLKPASKPGSTIYVPMGNETLVGRLRPLLDKAGLDDVLQRIREGLKTMPADREIEVKCAARCMNGLASLMKR